MQRNSYHSYEVVTPPAKLPVTLAEIKGWLKLPVADTSFDSELTLLAQAAVQNIERYTARTLINTTFKVLADHFLEPCDGFAVGIYPIDALGFEIQKSKLQTITSIKYWYGNTQITLAADQYRFIPEKDFSIIYPAAGKSFPPTDDIKNAVEIIFVAGYGANESDVPAALKLALLKLIAYYFENRGDCECDTSKIPAVFTRDLSMWRITNLL